MSPPPPTTNFLRKLNIPNFKSSQFFLMTGSVLRSRKNLLTGPGPVTWIICLDPSWTKFAKLPLLLELVMCILKLEFLILNTSCYPKKCVISSILVRTLEFLWYLRQTKVKTHCLAANSQTLTYEAVIRTTTFIPGSSRMDFSAFQLE